MQKQTPTRNQVNMLQAAYHKLSIGTMTKSLFIFFFFLFLFISINSIGKYVTSCDRRSDKRSYQKKKVTLLVMSQVIYRLVGFTG